MGAGEAGARKTKGNIRGQLKALEALREQQSSAPTRIPKQTIAPEWDLPCGWMNGSCHPGEEGGDAGRRSGRYRWMPADAAQKAALDSGADILLFGGSAGSLKTETMLMDAVQEYENPNLRAIVFRSSFVEMTDIIDKTRRLYAPLGGDLWDPQMDLELSFRRHHPLRLHEDGRRRMEVPGAALSFIGFDESTLHAEKQVRNILGRLSSTDARLRLRMRLTSNPGTSAPRGIRRSFCAATARCTTVGRGPTGRTLP